MLITFCGVNFSYGDNLIMTDVSFAIHEGERVGFVGENGAGKTTLIKLLSGELTADGGEIIRKNGIRVGYLEQNGGYDSENTVYGEMREVFKDDYSAVEKIESYSTELAGLDPQSREYSVLSQKIESLNKFIAARDSYNVDVRIKTVLGGMGFKDFFDRRIATMSGGEKTRLKLARLLLEEPDLLVLDEPTNHLDIGTLYWLEEYLASFKGAVFVVSHDRYFLDRVTARIVELENKKLSSYTGNYSKYKILKAERYERELKEYESQQEEIKRLQTYVDKNIVRATTAKSAQSRVKQLDRMELLEKPFTPPAPPRFKFTYLQKPAKEALKVSHLKLSAGEKTLADDVNLSVLCGDKVAVVGENGTGKSTLLKQIVAGKNPAVVTGRGVTFSYYDQEMANLDPENTVLEELWGRHVAAGQTEMRAALARCALSAEDMYKKVSALSGGERAKLALCVFENSGGNVLVLDEPTNHLDLPARESLEAALKAFDGTVLFVSHDRYFISAVAGKIAEIEDGGLTVYEGGYEGYKRAKEIAAANAREAEEERRRAEYESAKASAYRSKKDRAREAKLKSDIKAIEADICLNEAKEAELNELLSDPTVAADYVKVNEILKELEKVKSRLDALYAEYGRLIGENG